MGRVHALRRRKHARPVPVEGRAARRERVVRSAVHRTGGRAPAAPEHLRGGRQRDARRQRGGRARGDRRAVRQHRCGRHAEPALPLHVPARQRRAGRRGGVRRGDSLVPGAPRLPPAARAGGPRDPDGLLPGRPRRRQLRRRHPARARTRARRARLPLSGRTRSDRPSAGHRLRAQRPGAGVAAVVLPLVQRTGRRAARSGRAGPARRPGGAGAAGAADAGRPALEGARPQLRGPVALSAQSARRRTGRGGVSRVRREPARGVPAGDRALRREPHSRRPERSGPAGGRLHVRQRAARPALRPP